MNTVQSSLKFRSSKIRKDPKIKVDDINKSNTDVINVVVENLSPIYDAPSAKRPKINNRKRNLKVKPDNQRWPHTWSNVPEGRIPIFVVDKHHDVLKPIFDAIEEDIIPSAGLKMLHFDSHPDMANFDISCSKTLQQDLHRGKYNSTKVHQSADIATWILPLVLGGHINETAWVSCWFCNQMDVGTYQLLVGRDSTGRLKVASVNGTEEVADAVGLYFASRGCWVKRGQLKGLTRPWTLHVCRLDTEFNLPPEQSKVVESMCKSGSWLLDFDEDFVSCTNPFSMEFKALFGEDQYEVLQTLYDPRDGTFSHWDTLRSIVRRQLYLLPTQEFEALPMVQRLLELYPKSLIDQYLSMLSKLHSPYQGNMKLGDLFPPENFQNAGESIGLPHHVSTAEEILKIMSTTQSLLNKIENPPQIITAATSRADRYLPDTQATHIHRMSITTFCKRYNLNEADVQRLDTHLSL